jgi:hypothetical protein
VIRLSKDSDFIAQNWKTVTDILEAKSGLDKELADILYSLQERLVSEPWWNSKWLTRLYRNDQVYITNAEWQYGDADLIWIGLENFNAGSIFGNNPGPQLYVWIAESRTGLAKILKSLFDGHEQQTGDLDPRDNSRYVIRRYLQKRLPGEKGDLERYLEQLLEQTIYFISHYAQVLEKQQYDAETLIQYR